MKAQLLLNQIEVNSSNRFGITCICKQSLTSPHLQDTRLLLNFEWLVALARARVITNINTESLEPRASPSQELFPYIFFYP